MTTALDKIKQAKEDKANSETPATQVVVERKYQHYSCSRQAMRMISTSGRKITFVGYKYLTCEQEIIDYLDAEIKAGLNVITKGELLTSKEADPLEKLREKHIADYLAKQKAGANDNVNMGTTKSPEELLKGVNPLGTAGVTNVGPSDS